jgi:hypothetical protein
MTIGQGDIFMNPNKLYYNLDEQQLDIATIQLVEGLIDAI